MHVMQGPSLPLLQSLAFSREPLHDRVMQPSLQLAARS